MNARNYQLELFKEAQKRNVIIKLDTGSGKTYIALMLIDDYLKRCEKKKIFFLVKNASLGSQHQKYLQKHLFLKEQVGLYHGQLENTDVDFWSKDKWSEYISKHKIVIMTAKVFLDILLHCKYKIEDICLLIFDEVHHLSKNDDYAQIAENLKNASHLKILGLTACIAMNPKSPNHIEFILEELELKLKCTIITSKYDISQEHAVNLNEMVVVHQSEASADMDKILEVQVEMFKQMNLMATSTLVQVNERDQDSYLLSKIIRAFGRIYYSCGSGPLQLILSIYLEDLDQLISLEYDPNLKKCLERFKEFMINYKNYLQNLCSQDKKYYSDKIGKLIQILSNFEKMTEETAERFSILIFVKERIFALAIDKFFKSLVNSNKLSSFFKSEFITGHNQIKFPKELTMSTKRQESILKDFRDQKFNILVATNVIEEGLDVPSCNVVIKFDEINEFRSYIQSKGRARAETAYFYIFSSEKDSSKIRTKIRDYNQINEKINECLLIRAIDGNNDDDDDDDEPEFKSKRAKFDYIPYGNNGPKITLSTAASVLDRYIGRLRCNSISVIKRIYNFDDETSSVGLTLPMPSPCQEEIKVPRLSNKKLSKEMVNLAACQKLHQTYKELNDEDLLPKEKYKALMADMDIQTFNNEQNQHKKPVGETLTPNYQNKSDSNTNVEYFYLYSIKYSSDLYSNLGINNSSMFEDDISVGFLVKQKLLEVKKIEFPLYLIGGVCTVTVSNEGQFGPFTKQQVSLFERTHFNLFELYKKRINKFQSEIHYSPSDCLVQMTVILLRDYEIDLELIYDFVYTPPVSKSLYKSRKIHKWQSCVVRPMYNVKECGSFAVVNVKSNDRPNTRTSSEPNASSHYDYIVKAYPHFFNDPNNHLDGDERDASPMIQVKRLTTILSAINKPTRDVKSSKRLQKVNDTFMYVPGFVEVISLRVQAWIFLCLFPSVHYRLNQILVLSDLSRHCFFSHLVDWSVISGDDDKLVIPTDLPSIDISNLISFTTYSLHPNTFIQNFLPAITSLTCHERFSLESLEIFGDSFLKYATSKILYHMNPFDNEGSLSSKRIKMVCNKRLYQVSYNTIKLDQFFFNILFDTKSNYIFPKYKDQDNCLENMIYKNKSLSDCFEAVLGAIVINYGDRNGLKFLNDVGLDEKGDLDFLLDNMSIKDPRDDKPKIQALIIEKCGWIKELEEEIGYTFKNKALIIEAITHPTSLRNRDFGCYQRLEFLGDAVLDYLITVHIIYMKPELNPGKVTNLRSALVNNNTFAYAAVHKNLHKYLDYQDLHMNSMLPDAVEEIKKFNLELDEKFSHEVEGYKVILKVLGDIFESVIGAIYVDNGYNAEEVWSIIKSMLKEPLRVYMNRIPRNKIVQMHEKYPELKCTFEMEEFTNLFIMTADLGIENGNLDSEDSQNIYVVKERNKKLCKSRLADLLIV